MKTKEVIYWITERELMRIRKEAGMSKPHSKDPVMAHTRFTNVRREDDKVTKYLAGSWWRNKWSDDIVAKMVLARMINNIPTLSKILRIEDALPILRMLRDNGEKVWGSAYTITTCGRPMDKDEYVCSYVLPQVVALGPLPRAVQTLDACHKWLMLVDGLGSFLAAQVVADLKNIPDSPLRNAPDFMTWSAHGPGSLKGLSWFYGYTITPARYNGAINTAWHTIRPGLHPDLQDLHMQDVQNVFCEVSKYARISEGRGHARNKY